jgi:RNA polymerase sigma factor (sigma-70 family)
VREQTDPTPTPPVVFVVDDDPGIRKAFSRLLRSRGLSARTFDSAAAFLAAAPEAERGCVLLDLQMPKVGGLALQRELIERGVDYPVVFITGYATVATSVDAMKSGAVDFLEKPFDPDELMAAVQRALALHGEERSKTAEAREVGRRLARLTPRETEVMELVVGGLKNREVAERLGISERTVVVHRGRVMKKLEVDSLAALVRLVEADKSTRPIEPRRPRGGS